MALTHDPIAENASPLARYIAQIESQLMAGLVTDIFGFHAVQIGLNHTDLLKQSRIPHKHYLASHQDASASTVVAEPEFLPFADNSVDLVCLPHTLEQCADAQQALREVYRLLVAEGTLVITGITPVSVLGAMARWTDIHGLGHIQRQFCAWRICDWLSVLGFEVVQRGYCLHALPINDERWLARQRCLERWGSCSVGLTGGVYYLVAKKRVLNVRLLKPGWKKTVLPQAMPARKAQTPSQKQ